MLSPAIMVRILISLVLGLLIGLLWLFAHRPRRTWIVILIGIFGSLSIFGGVSALTLIPPRPVEVSIESPLSKSVVDQNIVTISGVVSPADAQVTVLVHPWDADRWWVQEKVTILAFNEAKDQASWQVEVNLGSGNVGAGEAFEVVALGSQGPVYYDILTDRFFLEGETLQSLPILSQSNSVIIFRKEK